MALQASDCGSNKDGPFSISTIFIFSILFKPRLKRLKSVENMKLFQDLVFVENAWKRLKMLGNAWKNFNKPFKKLLKYWKLNMI